MIEPEVAYNDITDKMDLAEDFIKYCVQWPLDNCADDVKFLNDCLLYTSRSGDTGEVQACQALAGKNACDEYLR